MAEAVGDHVADGTLVYIGNFGAQLFAVAHELIRQRRERLHVVASSGGILVDQLIGAGSTSVVTVSHCWSPVGPAPTWNFRRAMEDGTPAIELHELSLATLNAALTAGAWQMPFLPTVDLADTGYVSEGWTGGMLALVDTPFGSSIVVQALEPDVAFIHADRCDHDGNAAVAGPVGEVTVAAQAARSVVIVAEALVDAVPPSEVTVPGVIVDTVVEEPYALHPDGAAGRYERDVGAYQEYARASRTEDGFRDWLQRWVFGPGDRSGYLALAREGAGA